MPSPAGSLHLRAMSDKGILGRLAAAESALLSLTEATAAATAMAEEAHAAAEAAAHAAAEAAATASEAHAAAEAAAQSSWAWRTRALAWQTWWDVVTEEEILQEFAHGARDAPEGPGGGAGAAAGAAAGGGAAAHPEPHEEEDFATQFRYARAGLDRMFIGEHFAESLGERDAPEQPAEHHPEPLGERGAPEQPAEHRQGAYDPWRMFGGKGGGGMADALDHEALAVEDEYYRQLAMLCGTPVEPHPEPFHGEGDTA